MTTTPAVSAGGQLLDPSQYARQAWESNRDVLSGAISTAQGYLPGLVGSFNRLAADEFYKALEASFPGEAAVFGKMAQQTASMLSGRIPGDVQEQMTRAYAERGNRLGTGGSELSEYGLRRNLGVTSLALQQQGFAQAGQLYGIAKQYRTAPTADVGAVFGSMYSPLVQKGMVSATELASMDQARRSLELDAEKLKQEVSYKWESLRTEAGFKQQDIDETIRAHDLQNQYNLKQLELERTKLNQDLVKFNASMSWDRELSQINLQRENQRIAQQQQLYNQYMQELRGRTTGGGGQDSSWGGDWGYNSGSQSGGNTAAQLTAIDQQLSDFYRGVQAPAAATASSPWDYGEGDAAFWDWASGGDTFYE